MASRGLGIEEQRLILRLGSILAAVFTLEKSLEINIVGEILTKQLVGPISLGLIAGVLTLVYVIGNWRNHRWG